MVYDLRVLHCHTGCIVVNTNGSTSSRGRVTLVMLSCRHLSRLRGLSRLTSVSSSSRPEASGVMPTAAKNAHCAQRAAKGGKHQRRRRAGDAFPEEHLRFSAARASVLSRPELGQRSAPAPVSGTSFPPAATSTVWPVSSRSSASACGDIRSSDWGRSACRNPLLLNLSSLAELTGDGGCATTNLLRCCSASAWPAPRDLPAPLANLTVTGPGEGSARAPQGEERARHPRAHVVLLNSDTLEKGIPEARAV